MLFSSLVRKVFCRYKAARMGMKRTGYRWQRACATWPLSRRCSNPVLAVVALWTSHAYLPSSANLLSVDLWSHLGSLWHYLQRACMTWRSLRSA